MNKKFLIIFIFFVSFFATNAYATITFKQSKDISSDTAHLRGVTFKPDGSRMYVTTDEDSPTVIQYRLSSAFDISTATIISEDELEGHGGDFDKPHAIEF